MTTDSASTDPQHCPLCGGDNHCAMTTDPQATDCWCRDIEFTPELLTSIADKDKNRRCVCQQCAEKANQLASPAH